MKYSKHTTEPRSGSSLPAILGLFGFIAIVNYMYYSWIYDTREVTAESQIAKEVVMKGAEESPIFIAD